MSACKYCNVREYSAVINIALPYFVSLVEYKFVGYNCWCEKHLNM
jgi:hypothetical protein